MVNPNLDSGHIQNTSKVLRNGLIQLQFINFFEAKKPYSSDLVIPPYEGELSAIEDIQQQIDWMHGRKLVIPPPMRYQDKDGNYKWAGGINPLVLQHYQSLAGFEIRSPNGEIFRYFRPHIAARMEKEKRKNQRYGQHTPD